MGSESNVVAALARVSDEEFMRSPIGRYTVGAGSIVWCWDESLCGSVLWGRLTAEDTSRVLRQWSSDALLAPTYDAVTDVGSLSLVDYVFVEAAVSYIAGRMPTLNQRMRRHGFVLPHGFQGAVVAGVVALFGQPEKWHYFSSAPEAFAWVEHRDGLAIQRNLHEITALEVPALPVIERLRRLFAQSPRLSDGDAALALALSPQQVEQLLVSAGTSLAIERFCARLRIAEGLLICSDASIAEIGEQAGFANAAEFDSAFSSAHGVSPSEFRERHR